MELVVKDGRVSLKVRGIKAVWETPVRMYEWYPDTDRVATVTPDGESRFVDWATVAWLAKFFGQPTWIKESNV